MKISVFSVFTAVSMLGLMGCATQSDRPNRASGPQGEALHASSPHSERSDGLRSGPLFDELARMDGALFDASFASCDAAIANAIFTDDVEFYHDKDGLSVGEKVRENTRRLTASCPGARGVTRTLVPGSLRVYPIAGYGAVQTGVHRFDERGAATSTVAIFTNLWRFQDGRWRLARVLSLDHHAVPSQEAKPRP
jgi:hypothetical protein